MDCLNYDNNKSNMGKKEVIADIKRDEWKKMIYCTSSSKIRARK